MPADRRVVWVGRESRQPGGLWQKLKLLYRDSSNRLANFCSRTRIWMVCSCAMMFCNASPLVAIPRRGVSGLSGFAQKQNKSCFEVVAQGTFEGIPSSASTASRSRFGVAMEIASISMRAGDRRCSSSER